MRVAARLDGQPRDGRGGQIAGHRQGRAPEKRERGHHHPAVPDWHQLRNPRLPLLLQQADRVWPVRWRVEHRMAVAWHLSPRGLTAGRALGRGQPPHPWVKLVPLRTTGWSLSRQCTHHRLLSVRRPSERPAPKRADRCAAAGARRRTACRTLHDLAPAARPPHPGGMTRCGTVPAAAADLALSLPELSSRIYSGKLQNIWSLHIGNARWMVSLFGDASEGSPALCSGRPRGSPRVRLAGLGLPPGLRVWRGALANPRSRAGWLVCLIPAG